MDYYCPNGSTPTMLPPLLTPICSDGSMAIQGSTSSNVGNVTSSSTAPWWAKVINVIPGVLGGAADVIGATKGNTAPAPVTNVYNQAPIEKDLNKQTMPVWAIVLIIVLAILLIGFVIYFASKNKKNTKPKTSTKK